MVILGPGTGIGVEEMRLFPSQKGFSVNLRTNLLHKTETIARLLILMMKMMDLLSV